LIDLDDTRQAYDENQNDDDEVDEGRQTGVGCRQQ